MGEGELMSDAYVIELQGNAVGIIVRKHKNESNYRFLSALHSFNSLEGQEFPGPLQAEIAARKVLKESPHALQKGRFKQRY
ncbi:MAG TPA: hypothetical protein VNR65_07520 [Geobacterales bacterium]|jgi:hypothetical protein|nr:hypothetical protein [Geobacterales bacterium]